MAVEPAVDLLTTQLRKRLVCSVDEKCMCAKRIDQEYDFHPLPIHDMNTKLIRCSHTFEHSINSRKNGCSLKLPKAKLEFRRKSFAFQGALVYNTLPRHLRILDSRFLFKSNLKEFFQ